MKSPDEIRERVIEVLKTVHDPEIDVNIYDLGLIYSVQVDQTNVVTIDEVKLELGLF